MNDPYQNLAQEIIVQAVREWQGAVKKLKKRPNYEPARKLKEECERFFLSGWFYELAGVEGSVILKKLQEEAFDDQ